MDNICKRIEVEVKQMESITSPTNNVVLYISLVRSCLVICHASDGEVFGEIVETSRKFLSVAAISELERTGKEEARMMQLNNDSA